MTTTTTPPPVHLQAGNPSAALDNVNGRAFPLTFPPGLRGKAHRVIAHLNVRRSLRYRAAAGQTFCNIFAHDYCHGMGVYLPRVWWDGAAIMRWQNGERVPPVYARTVLELNANALYMWLVRWGATFGWQRASFTEVQDRVNAGAVGVLSAIRRDPSKSGHIAVIVPETATHMAARAGETVIAPLQCQAGSINKEYWTGGGWWEAPTLYSGHGAWYCELASAPAPAEPADVSLSRAEKAVQAALQAHVERFPQHRIQAVEVIDRGSAMGAARFEVDIVVKPA